MRKPSELKQFVDNQIKFLAEEVHKLQFSIPNGYNEVLEKERKLESLNAKLEVLFTVQKICEERKRY